MAEVAYQRGELDTALEHLSEGIARCRQLAYTQPLAAGLATLAWIRQAQGDRDGALEAMGEAEQIAPSPSVANLFNPIPVQRARLLLAQGDIAAAGRWTQERGLRADDEPMYQKEREHLVLARVLLAQDRAAQALTLLERLLAAAAAQGRTGSIIEIRALQALALASGGEQASAVETLAEALTLACPQGYVRVFADEGAPMEMLSPRRARHRWPAPASATSATRRLNEETAVKHTRAQRPRARREPPWGEALPADPRDPAIVRAKALARAGRPGQQMTGRAVPVPGPAEVSERAVPGRAVRGKPAATGITR